MEEQVNVQTIDEASERIKGVAHKTPLQLNTRLSEKYKAHIYIKREDLQDVRSYKIRGSYNFMSQLQSDQAEKGVVCASAGNHAQGVAHSAALLKIKATIFMPTNTIEQKIQRV